ncbi:MAG: hypothetical protein DWQ40_05300, partial [Actinobacteria bacterium]
MDRSVVDPDLQCRRHGRDDRRIRASHSLVGDKLNIEVPVDLDGERLDKVLADLLDVSRSVARGLFDGGVEVDGAQAKPNTRVSRGSIV